MIKLPRYLKFILINLTVFSALIFSLFALLEILLQTKSIIRKLNGGERTIPNIKYCYDETIKPYGYCSFITHKKDIKKEGLDYKSVDIFVDKLGGRVNSETNQKIDPKIYRNFLIGDSYVQADEIPFEKTIQGISRSIEDKSKHLYGIGVGSWNTNQYLQVVEKLAKTNSNYTIFLSPNDVFPNYSLSSLRQSKKFFLKYLRSINWIYGKIRFFVIKIVNGNNDAFQETLKNTISTKYKDCSAFNSREYQKIKRQTRTDHLIYSKHFSCWPKKYKKSVDHSINELKIAHKKIKEKNSNLRVFIIPFSLSFKNEQTEGRMAYFYRYPNSVAISQKGLAEYLIKNLPFQVIDLEPIFEKELSKVKNSCKSCDNHFYLKYDGHLTPLAHKFLHDNYFK